MAPSPIPQQSLSQKIRLLILKKPPISLSHGYPTSQCSEASISPTVSVVDPIVTLAVHHVNRAVDAIVTLPRSTSLVDLKVQIAAALEMDASTVDTFTLHRVQIRVAGVSEILDDAQLARFLELFKFAARTHIYVYPVDAKHVLSPVLGVAAGFSDNLVEEMSLENDVAPAKATEDAPTPVIVPPQKPKEVMRRPSEARSLVQSVGVKSQKSQGDATWW